MHQTISVTVLSKNSAATIAKTLESVSQFPEVIVLDTGSDDETLSIAARYPNVRVLQKPFTGFGPLHNSAAEAATHDWILSLDADEVLSAPLEIKLDEDCIYSFPFHNYYNGKWIKWCGWYPDRHTRLYNRKKTRFSEAMVHEKIQTTGLAEIKLRVPIFHYSYRSVDDFLIKMHRYSSLFSAQNAGKPSSLTKAISHGIWAFVKSYILKLGFMGGREGFIISLYNCHVAYYKYLKLAMQ